MEILGALSSDLFVQQTDLVVLRRSEIGMTFAAVIAAVLFGPALLIMVFALGYKLKRLWRDLSAWEWWQ